MKTQLAVISRYTCDECGDVEIAADREYAHKGREWAIRADCWWYVGDRVICIRCLRKRLARIANAVAREQRKAAQS